MRLVLLGEIDLPVTSYGVYIGAFRKIANHLVLVSIQRLFAQGYRGIDCTIIPAGTVENILVLLADFMNAENVRAQACSLYTTLV